MALFTNLHHVGEVLAALIANDLPEPVSVQVGPPLDAASGVGDEVRVTLLWTALQPTHRNDPFEPNATGGRTPPPVSLSTFFLVTTYGSTVGEDPQRAHELLGNVIQILHTTAEIRLPAPASPGLGEGRLTFAPVPSTAELMEHVFVPLQVRHRPWVLYEVAPVQLAMLAPDSPPSAMVRPGGVRLGGPNPHALPALRVTPSSQGAGGVVRLDVVLQGRALTQVRVGSEVVAPSALSVVHPNQTLLLTLPPSARASSTTSLRLRVGDPASDAPVQFSNAEPLAISSVLAPTLDAPAPSSLAVPLVLGGRALADAVELLLWPDAPIADPSQVRSSTLSSVSATSISAALGASGVGPGVYRASARLTSGLITPFVLLELTP